jgi:hypothetical protein
MSVIKNRGALSNFFNEMVNAKNDLERSIIENKLLYADVKRKPEEIEDDRVVRGKYINENKFSISPLNRYYLERFLSECTKNNIKVFYFFPPLLKDYYEREANGVYISSYKSYIDGQVKDHNNLYLLTDDFYVVTSDKLLNSIEHLTASEAQIYTGMIARKIIQFIKYHE